MINLDGKVVIVENPEVLEASITWIKKQDHGLDLLISEGIDLMLSDVDSLDYPIYFAFKKNEDKGYYEIQSYTEEPEGEWLYVELEYCLAVENHRIRRDTVVVLGKRYDARDLHQVLAMIPEAT